MTDAVKIYVSSRNEHVLMWRYYRQLGHNIISSWIDLEGILDHASIGATYWPIWLAEAHGADYLIFYAVQTDKGQHGASLLEIGACLAGGGTILHVGVSDTMKTLNGELADFTGHPKWNRLPDLVSAFRVIQEPAYLSEMSGNTGA